MGLLLIFTSCTSDDTTMNEEEIACNVPANFAILEYNFLSQVVLNWDTEIDITSWEVEYGISGFSQGQGTVVEAINNTFTISGLNFNVAYDFYVRANCGNDQFSDWSGPVTNVPENNSPQSQALMTANIAGTQYNNLRPFSWNISQTAILMTTFTGTTEKFIHIQGNSAPGVLLPADLREINIYIPESQWSTGTYTLYNDSLNASQNPTSFVNIVYFDSSDNYSQAFEEDDGTITITEFNTTDRVIRGTFNFSFKRVNPDTGDEIGPLDCLNGTFNYLLDHSTFD
ncbi:fibronectin type III domain-containing protein [Kordia periserrulae]|uniref:fibronectin type III domain-containing protein n=1 Tax=Kordia periserrulae TaxID=701523 RepID=UPI0011B27817|nr:fibronectin type III domain-containing protein [Kordia periserrulae]